MAKQPNRVTENQVAFAIVQIAKTTPNNVVSFARCRKEVPDHLTLSTGDLTQSTKRPNEAMWEQLIRNIKSHHDVPGNYIHAGYLQHVPKVGYQATKTGMARTKP